MKIRSIYIIIILLIAGIQSLTASEFLCTYTGINDGMTQSYVTCVTRDHRGFVWIGTRFGLNRYDFWDIDNYYEQSNDSTSIPDNYVRNLFTDSKGRVWVACERGTAYYNEASNDFNRLSLDGSRLNARAFYDDGKGVILGGAGKLFYYSHADGSLTRMPSEGGPTMFFTGIEPRNKDEYVLRTRWDGVWLYDIATQKITRYPGIDYKHIMASMIDPAGYLWVAPYGKGLYCYDRRGNCIDSLSSSNSDLSNDIVLDIMLHENKMWIATDGGGLSIYNPATRDFEVTGLSSPRAVTCLYRDRHDNIYGGTVRDGLMNVRRVSMRSFQNTPAMGTRISAIVGVCRDRDGTTWIADDGNGVLRFNDDNTLVNIPSTADMKVLCMVEFDKNNMLLSTYDRGFFLLDKNTLQLHKAPQVLEDLRKAYAGSGQALRLIDIGGGNFAITADQVYVYNTRNNTISKPIGRKEGTLSPIYHTNSILVCFANDGVFEYDLVTGSQRRLVSSDELHSTIALARYDGQENIYFSTGTDLYCYNISRQSVENIDIGELRRISSLAIDGDYLWIGSNMSIYLLDTKRNRLLKFDEFDGVAANEYLPNAVTITPETVYMGGVNGLLRIDRSDLNNFIKQEASLTLNIADLTVDGESVYGHIDGGEIDINPDFTSINLKVIADGGNYLQRRPIRYHIVGGDVDRIIKSSSHNLDLSMLKQGHDYDILASTTLPDGTWGPERKIMTMHMLAPWYTSGWLMATVLLLIIAGLAINERSRRQRHRRRMERRLEEYRNSSLERELSFLVNTNYALRTPLTLIYAPVKHLIEQARHNEENRNLPELQIIYSNAKKMRDAINMALELHHVGFEKADVKLGVHPLQPLVDQVVDSRQGESDIKRIGVLVNAPRDTIYVTCDPERLSIILGTFIDNSLHRSTEKGVVRVQTRLSEDGRSVRIEISDYGLNLDDDQLEVLFSKYSTESSAISGNALGFAYAKTMALAQNGQVGAFNHSDVPGLTVWVEIPLGDKGMMPTRQSGNNRVTIPEHTPDSLVSETDTSEMTAIIVEDDKDLCMFVANSLAPHFRNVLHAFNGKDAWMLIQQYQPDIVISSLMLSVKSGLELCRDLKNRPETSHIPVILLTAFKDDPELEQGYSAGADSYLTKPFDISVLLTRCRNLLHNRSVLRRHYEKASSSGAIRPGLPNASESFLLKIDQAIDENINNPDFGVDELVECMRMSRSALYNRFKELTGSTLATYILEYRIGRARQMLKTNDYTVSELAESLGFRSARYFSTVFKNLTGVTPSEYRKAKV